MHVEYLEHSHAEASVVQRGARSIWVQRSAALWISSLSWDAVNARKRQDLCGAWSAENEKNLDDANI